MIQPFFTPNPLQINHFDPLGDFMQGRMMKQQMKMQPSIIEAAIAENMRKQREAQLADLDTQYMMQSHPLYQNMMQKMMQNTEPVYEHPYGQTSEIPGIQTQNPSYAPVQNRPPLEMALRMAKQRGEPVKQEIVDGRAVYVTPFGVYDMGQAGLSELEKRNLKIDEKEIEKVQDSLSFIADKQYKIDSLIDLVSENAEEDIFSDLPVGRSFAIKLEEAFGTSDKKKAIASFFICSYTFFCSFVSST
jgi:hypothetical protein